MPNNSLDVATSANMATLIRFTWGWGNEACYALWTADILASGKTYKALPTIEVDYKEQHGGSKDQPIELRMPSSTPPLNRMLFSRFAPVLVTVLECDPTDVLHTLRTTFEGRILRTKKAKGMQNRTVLVTVAGKKRAFAMRLGLIVASSCQWRFGDRICGVSLEDKTESGTVMSCSGSYITIGGLPTRPEITWDKGSVEVDGYVIGIRSWTEGVGFLMVRPPPEDWVGKSCVVVAGCGKLIANCRFYANEGKFGAIGTKCPNKHPMLKIP